MIVRDQPIFDRKKFHISEEVRYNLINIFTGAAGT
jgi:hypothetical protein